jgi:hypothetical protein
VSTFGRVRTRGQWIRPSPAEVARAVVVPYVISRVVVLATLGITRHIVDALHVAPKPQATSQGLLAWDAAFYRDIARGGYDAVPQEGLRFFPLVPLLARAVSWLPAVDTDLALLLVSNVSALALGVVLHRLAWTERGDEAFARRAVWFVYLAPSAFVLVMGYAEATFMTAAAVVLLGVRRRRWWIAAAAGYVAGLTRPLGLLLAVPALVETLQERRSLTRADIAARVAAVAAPAAGLLTYLGWAADRGDDLLYPLRVQQDPERRGTWRFPVTNVIDAIRDLGSGDHYTLGLHLAALGVLVVLTVVLIRRWPASYAAYGVVSLFLAASASNLDSVERYSLSTLPFVLAAADVTDEELRERSALVVTTAALVVCSVLAFTQELVP